MSQLRQRRAGGGGGDADGPRAGRLGARRITLETFDVYAKTTAEESVKTSAGGGVSLASLVVIALLVAAELWRFAVPRREEHLVVDRVIEGRMRINFDISFAKLNCLEANLDAMDVAGEQQNGVEHDVQKVRLDGDTGRAIGSAYAVRLEVGKNASGGDGAAAAEGGDGAAVAAAAAAEPTPLPADYCGSCFGAESAVSRADAEGRQCCNTCDELRGAYQSKGWDSGELSRTAEQCVREHHGAGAMVAKQGEGCRISGFLLVNKVAGNFHIAMGETHARGAGHIHQFNPAQIAAYNVSHTVHSLSFGLPFAGQKNPLDGARNFPKEGSGVYMFYVKVVPTVLLGAGGRKVLETNQYSVAQQYRPAVVDGQRQNVLPGLFFVYDFSPFSVTINDAKTTTLAQLVTSLCAILGGVITFARLADALLYQLGKVASQGSERGGTGAKAAVADAILAAASSVQRAASTTAASVGAAATAATAGAGAVAGGAPGGGGGGGAGLGASGVGFGGQPIPGVPKGAASKVA